MLVGPKVAVNGLVGLGNIGFVDDGRREFMYEERCGGVAVSGSHRACSCLDYHQLLIRCNNGRRWWVYEHREERWSGNCDSPWGGRE